MKQTQKFTLNQDFKAEKFDNETLLYAVSSGKGIYLNETARPVWEMCGKGHSVGEIIALLEEAFPDRRADIRDDVEAAVDSLVEHGALLHADE